jgi:hypothetical protein
MGKPTLSPAVKVINRSMGQLKDPDASSVQPPAQIRYKPDVDAYGCHRIAALFEGSSIFVDV